MSIEKKVRLIAGGLLISLIAGCGTGGAPSEVVQEVKVKVTKGLQNYGDGCLTMPRSYFAYDKDGHKYSFYLTGEGDILNKEKRKITQVITIRKKNNGKEWNYVATIDLRGKKVTRMSKK